jgi:ABC-type cobalamin transport system ATPase subunit
MANIAYYAQDHAADFAEDMNLFDWMKQWTKGDEQLVRATLGRLLFSQDDIGKSVKVISGGEQGRMLFGRLMLQRGQCDGAGRTDQSLGYGVDRILESRVGKLPWHAAVCQP